MMQRSNNNHKQKEKIQLVLMDLSGTVHIGSEPIHGAIQACQQLVNNNIRLQFLTNTSKESRQSLFAKLRQMGFDDDILSDVSSIRTSVSATREFLLRHKLRPYCLVEPDLLLQQQDLANVPLDPPHNCVVVGLAPTQLCYNRLNEAFRILQSLKQQQQQQHPILIAIHAGKYFRDTDHELSLGPGGFVQCLEYATGVKAVVLGKPNAVFFQGAYLDCCDDDKTTATTTTIDPSNVVMIGDDVLQDVQGAIDAGIGTAILVQTGKYVPGDEAKLLPNKQNIVVVQSVVQAVNYILERNNAAVALEDADTVG